MPIKAHVKFGLFGTVIFIILLYNIWGNKKEVYVEMVSISPKSAKQSETEVSVIVKNGVIEIKNQSITDPVIKPVTYVPNINAVFKGRVIFFVCIYSREI